MKTKKCTKCTKTKSLEEFNKYKRSKDGKRSICKICQREQGKKYYNKTIDYQRSRKKDNSILSPSAKKLKEQQELSKYNKKRCLSCNKIKNISSFHKNPQRPDGINTKCKNCRKVDTRKFYNNHKERLKEKSSKYYENNKKSIIQKGIEKRKWKIENDPFYRASLRIRRRLYDYMRKKDWHKNTSFNHYIGCSLKDLKEHIESQFQDNMSWDNYGVKGWHIDHNIPLSLASTPEELEKLCHYSNLKPMWAKDNIKKGNKINVEKKPKNLQKYELLPNENDKSEIIKSMKSKKKRIFARKCTIKTIDSKIEKSFLNNTHIQGYHPSSIAIGLFYKDELVSVMTFGRPRFNKEYEWEIIRFSSKLNTIVVGGASKLYKNFLKEYNPLSVISYCDLRFGTGDVYNKIGMTYVGKTKSNYYYIKDKEVLSRYQCMKKKLKNRLPIFLSKLTESENMMINGYTKVYDLGNAKFIWVK